MGAVSKFHFFPETDHEAADILKQSIKSSITTEPPYRPKAGKVYVFSDADDRNKKMESRWLHNYGTKKYESEGMEIEKKHHLEFQITKK